VLRHTSGFAFVTYIVAALCLIQPTAWGETLVLEIASATADFDRRTKEPIVSIVFTKESGIMFAKFTSSRVGKTTEMRLDGQVLAKSVIREPILGGSMQISERFTVEQTHEIASRLPAGSRLEVEAVEK
jgi:preprotein translocase subunit SecD